MRSKSAGRKEKERCLELEWLGLECRRHFATGVEWMRRWVGGWLDGEVVNCPENKEKARNREGRVF